VTLGQVMPGYTWLVKVRSNYTRTSHGKTGLTRLYQVMLR